MPIRTLIVDDQPAFAQLLEFLLSVEQGIEVVGRAGNGAEGAALAASVRPDVVLMDLEMPVLDGIEATARIRATSPASQVLIVTASTSAGDVERARDAGAAGYLVKGCPPAEIVAAVRRAGQAADASGAPARRLRLLPSAAGSHTVGLGLASA
jgi:two-component system response regulator DesR